MAALGITQSRNAAPTTPEVKKRPLNLIPSKGRTPAAYKANLLIAIRTRGKMYPQGGILFRDRIYRRNNIDLQNKIARLGKTARIHPKTRIPPPGRIPLPKV